MMYRKILCNIAIYSDILSFIYVILMSLYAVVIYCYAIFTRASDTQSSGQTVQ